MRCIVTDDLDSEFLEARVQEVLDRFKGEEGLEFTYIFQHDDDTCRKLADQLGVDKPEDFIEHCTKEHSSSFRSGDDEYLAIRISEPFLQNDEAAARGLIAHELTHTVQRDSGIEAMIEDAAATYADGLQERFSDHGITEDETMQFIQTVLATTVFCLKDIFANSLLIEQGFGDDLAQYYSQVLGLESFCPMPAFYTDHETIDQVSQAMEFELQLVPAWLPFAGHDDDRYTEIRDRIEDCYATNIPESEDRGAAYEQLYRERFDDPDAFTHAFLDAVTDHWIEKVRSVRD